MSWGRSSDGNSKQGHLSRKQCQEVNCSHSAQYQKVPGKFVQLTIYSVQLLSCVLLFAIPWTAACHYVFNPCKSKLPWKIPSHRSEWPLSKNLQRIWAAEDGGKREFSYTLSGGVNGCRNYQNQQGSSLSTKHPETTCPENPLSGLRRRENQNSQWPVHPCFQGSSIDNGQEPELLLAKILAFSTQWSQIKNTETEFDGDKKVAFIPNTAEREHNRVMSQGMCTPHPPPWRV